MGEISLVHSLLNKLQQNKKLKKSALTASERKVIKSIVRNRNDIYYNDEYYYMK